jgi:hypothetical protein
MSNPTTSLDVSRKIFEIIGKTKVYFYWRSPVPHHGIHEWEVGDCENSHAEENIPAYTFGELLRVLPLIAEKNRLSDPHRYDVMMNASRCYMFASTPEQGMKDVETYLEQYL